MSDSIQTRKAPSKNQPKQPQQKRVERVYSGSQTVAHDLFKLKIAKTKKLAGYTDLPGPEDYIDIEHVHLFHTIDSDGKVQIHSTAIGGHFHVMEVIPSSDPSLSPTVNCISGPMKMGYVKDQYGRPKRQPIPVNQIDNHTHEIEYLKSDKITIRQKNMDAANLSANIEAQGAMPAGIANAGAR